jgi:predicted dinucleotide-binding enzyme
MNIGIMGAGHIGATLAGILIKAGYSVAISNSRNPSTLQDLVAQLGSKAQALSPRDAAYFGELVIEAIPFGRYQDLPTQELKGKILISAANYYPDRDGYLDLQGLSHTQFFTQHLMDVRVVKAFNTIYWEHLRDQGDNAKPLSERRTIPLAGDDPEAKVVVSQLIESLGFAPLDMGSLADSWIQQPGEPIYNKTLTVDQIRALIQ